MRILRSSLPALLVTCFVAASLLASGQATTPAATQPSSTSTTLWAHHDNETDELVGWMNTAQAQGTDNAMGPSGSCNNATETAAGNVPMSSNETVNDALFGDLIDRIYNLTLAPGLTSTLQLDPARNITATIFFGAGSCAGHPRLFSSLFSGSTLVATGNSSHTYAAGAPYANSTVNMTVQNATLHMEQPLVWQVRVNGTFYGLGFLGVGELQGRSRIDLPILPAQATETTTTTTTQSSTTTTTSRSTTTTASSTTTTASSSTTSEAPAQIQSQDSPSPGLLLLAAGLLVTAFVARRRLP